MDAEIIGISGNLTFSQQAFADYLKLNFPLVSDYPDLKTIDAYGVLDRERRVPQRSYFIVDKRGVIRYKHIVGRGQPLVSNEILMAEIKKIH